MMMMAMKKFVEAGPHLDASPRLTITGRQARSPARLLHSSYAGDSDVVIRIT